MNVVSRGENGNFAPFNLTQTPKFNKKTDKVQLAISTFKIANNYFEAAQILLKQIHLMPVVLTNISFACELYLKALLHGYNVDFGNTHGLKDLFVKLPEDIKNYISQNIAIDNRDTEFELCLTEQNDAFIIYRYMNEVKTITANPYFLFAFAHILKFVYESLIEEYSKTKEQEVAYEQI